MLLSFFGVIHTYRFLGNETVSDIGWNTGGRFAFGYLCFSVMFLVFHFWRRWRSVRGLPEELIEE
jgi:hypothetical protein